MWKVFASSRKCSKSTPLETILWKIQGICSPKKACCLKMVKFSLFQTRGWFWKILFITECFYLTKNFTKESTSQRFQRNFLISVRRYWRGMLTRWSEELSSMFFAEYFCAENVAVVSQAKCKKVIPIIVAPKRKVFAHKNISAKNSSPNKQMTLSKKFLCRPTDRSPKS